MNDYGPISKFWPDRDDVQTCILWEADDIPDHLLMAIHQPVTFFRRDLEQAGTEGTEEASEQQLLADFLSDEDSDLGYKISPITGQSGVGKSHVIRWMGAQIDRHPERKRMVVVRVPKSANLKSVVSSILEPLIERGEKQYINAAEQLDDVIAEVTPEEGAIQLRSNVEICLGNVAKNALRRKKLLNSVPKDERKASDKAKREDLNLEIIHADNLAKMFRDPALSDYFDKNVFEPLIQGSITGRTGQNDEEDEDEDFLPQFTELDLTLPVEVPLGQASTPVQTYLTTHLKPQDDEARTLALEILNQPKVLDESISRVFRLQEALSGTTITFGDMLKRIRELLFVDGSELVVLIEDLKVLSGIQQELTKAAIQGVGNEDETPRCFMRTALAVTDGFLAGDDTFRTRAKYEWVVKPISHAQQVDTQRLVDLTGAYLNAARYGIGQLKHEFEEARDEVGKNSGGWLKPWSPEEQLERKDQEVVDSFGESSKGEALFPFNKESLIRLANDRIEMGATRQLTARSVIKVFLKPTLQTYRPFFDKQEFPPDEFGGSRGLMINSDVLQWIQQAVELPEQERFIRVVRFWGGSVTGVSHLFDIPPEIFRAFGLKAPVDLDASIKPTRRTEDFPEPDTNKPMERSAVQEDSVKKWETKFQEWVSGTRLIQGDANDLRTWLHEGVFVQIDWHALGFQVSRSAFPHTALYLPNAQGSGTYNPKTHVNFLERWWGEGDGIHDKDGRIRRAFKSLVRYYDVNKKKKDYPEYVDDAVRIAWLIELATGYAERLLVENLLPEAESIGAVLIRQANILGFQADEKNASTIRAVTYKPTLTDELLDGGSFEQLKKIRNGALRYREHLIELFWARAGCFQGTAKTVYGTDPSRSTDATSDSKITAALKFFSSDQRDERNHITSLKDSRLSNAYINGAKNLIKVRDAFVDKVGDGWTLNSLEQLRTSLRALMDEIQRQGVLPQTIDRTGLDSVVEKFVPSEVEWTLNALSSVDVDSPLDVLIARVGIVDLRIVDVVEKFTREVPKFVSDMAKALEKSPTGEVTDLSVIQGNVSSRLAAVSNGLGLLANANGGR